MIKLNDVQQGLTGIIKSVVRDGKATKAGTWQATDDFKDLTMLVLRNHFFKFQIPNTEVELAKVTKADHEWCIAHFNERVGGKPTNPGEAYKIWPYNTFKPEDDPYMDGKQFSHTYQERFWPKKANKEKIDWLPEENLGIRYLLGDLLDLINQLADNPLTRQAYLPIFFPEDTGAVHGERVPCTLGYYFWVEDNALHCNYIIRSCDVFRHFRNDVYLTARLVQHIAAELELEVGELTFMPFNLHVFENDIYPLTKKEAKL